jgi:cell wall-associated NlpC family hydrolase
MRKPAVFISASLILLIGCSGPARKPAVRTGIPPLSRKDAGKLLSGAGKHIGEPYRPGGTSSSGWDCSGFVYGMYGRYLSVYLPRTTKALYTRSMTVPGSKSRPGDLVFFKIKSGRPSHVGIYLGHGRFIHASTSSGVIVSSLDEEYYRNSFAGFKRPLYASGSRSR